ncbi:hypothetical protein BDY24DRAFT_392892 [Mrakia frigida]|uniref:uncharacterized protein n=1 Tax=Mrakia frigida TaxID=29902 RepID=UPI003FCC2201
MNSFLDLFNPETLILRGRLTSPEEPGLGLSSVSLGQPEERWKGPLWNRLTSVVLSNAIPVSKLSEDLRIVSSSLSGIVARNKLGESLELKIYYDLLDLEETNREAVKLRLVEEAHINSGVRWARMEFHVWVGSEDMMKEMEEDLGKVGDDFGQTVWVERKGGRAGERDGPDTYPGRRLVASILSDLL